MCNAVGSYSFVFNLIVNLLNMQGPNSIEKKPAEKPTENLTEKPTEIPYTKKK